MRLFFAFALDDPVRTAVAGALDQLKDRLARSGSPRAVKWVERENLHVTLRFLGEVDAARSRELLDSLKSSLPVAPFELAVGGAGAFPSSRAPSVLWVGITSGAEPAGRVFEALDARLAPLGFEREPRAYTPHLTLGRVREIQPAAGRDLREWLAQVPGNLGIQHVTRATLYRSLLSSSGPRYEVLAEIPLS